jgi:YVTN family beta-propeller protein
VKHPIFRMVALLSLFGFSPEGFSQQVIATIAVGQRPIYIAADQKTNRIYVSNQSDDTVSVIDGATNQVLAAIGVGHNPNGIAVNPKTNTIYVANLSSGSLSIINGTNWTASTLAIGSSPAKVAVDLLTGRVFVTLEDRDGFLDVVDAKGLKIIAAIRVPAYPLGVAVDSSAHRIYVADFLCGCGKISVVDNKTDKVVNTVHLPGASMVVGVALDPRNNFLYAADENKGLFVIDRTRGKVLGHVSDHSYPNEVTAIPGTTLAVEPDSASDRAVFVDGSTFAVKKRVRVGKFPTGVAVNVATRRVYVTNRLDNTVSVIQLPDNW